jgi:hypothetical protein
MEAMDIPWKPLAAVEKDREYLALLSYLPLNRYSKIFAFMRFSAQINKQLRATPGAMGYSMRALLFTRRFWTLSVWEDSAALMEFVAKVPHSESMKAMAPFMGKTQFTQWKVSGAAVPLRWDEAIRRMS